MKIPTHPLHYRHVSFEDFENVYFNKMYAVNVQHKKKVYMKNVLSSPVLPSEGSSGLKFQRPIYWCIELNFSHSSPRGFRQS